MAKRSLWSLFSFNRPNIERMKLNEDVDGLANALSNRDPKVREEARAALGTLGDSAAAIVIHMLKTSKRSGNIHHPVRLLALLTSPLACEALCAALHDDDPNTRLTTYQYMRGRTDAGLVGPLLQAAQDPKVSVEIQTILRQVLYESATQIPEELLRKAAALNDSYVVIFTQNVSSCSFVGFTTSSEEADFSTIKQLARQELIRRGLDA